MRAVRVGLMAVALSALASCQKAPCDPPYSCPASQTDGGTAVVNCVPPADGSPECVGTCNAWLIESCPDVTFIY